MLKRWLGIGWFVLTMMTGGTTMTAAARPVIPPGLSLNGQPTMVSPPTRLTHHVQLGDSQRQQLVTLTSGAHQFGAVWSQNSDAFRLSRNQTVGFWVNFGIQPTASEGLAFVLQNDARTVNAQPNFGTHPIGETLGVFGAATNPYQGSVTALSRTAIQNSWALAFVNTPHQLTGTLAPGRADSFGVGAPKTYVAAAYPGTPSTYRRHVIAGTSERGWSPKRYWYQLAHQGVLPTTQPQTTLADGQWHHVTLRWCAATKKMTYWVNDGGSKTGTQPIAQHRTVSVDVNQIDPAHTGYARWGVTTTTGASSQANPSLVFTRVPQGIKSAGTKAQGTTRSTRPLAHRQSSASKSPADVKTRDVKSGSRSTGRLAFAALSTASGFQSTAVTEKQTLVSRRAGWHIEVQDTRGTGNRWALMVQAQPLINRVTKQPMAGTPVFVDGATVTPLGSRPTVIMTHTTNDQSAQGRVNVAAHWSAHTGILLRTQPGTEVGHYRGKLLWTLTNAPQ